MYFRFQDKLLSVTEFLDLMRRKNRQNSLTDKQNSIIPQNTSSVKTDSRSFSENQYINIMFITEEKLTTNIKRRYESQVIITFLKNVLFISE